MGEWMNHNDALDVGSLVYLENFMHDVTLWTLQWHLIKKNTWNMKKEYEKRIHEWLFIVQGVNTYIFMIIDLTIYKAISLSIVPLIYTK